MTLAAEVLALLEEIEWSAGRKYPRCPACEQAKDQATPRDRSQAVLYRHQGTGHAPACELVRVRDLAREARRQEATP